MKFVLAHAKKYGKHPAVKYSDTNVGSGDGFKTYPLYAIGFMKAKPIVDTITPIDISQLKSLES